MTAILAFEASSRQASWCYQRAGEELGCGDGNGRPAAATLVADLHEAIARFGRPDALAVAAGPGSFTGLRIAVVAARTLAWLEDLPVHPVDTLAAIAANAAVAHPTVERFLVLQVLKRDTTFWGLYAPATSGVRTLAGPSWSPDATPPAFPADAAGALLVGPALADKPALAGSWGLAGRLGSPAACDARGVLRAALGVPAVDWRACDADYGIASAPELQRQAGGP